MIAQREPQPLGYCAPGNEPVEELINRTSLGTLAAELSDISLEKF
jgi:hypothetical protein